MRPLAFAPSNRREKLDSELDAIFLGFACWIPLAAFIVLIAFALFAALKAGHWPYYSNPDPKDLKTPLLHAAALLAYPIALVSIPACLLVVIAAWRSLRCRDIGLFMVGVALWTFTTPVTGQLFGWLID